MPADFGREVHALLGLPFDRLTLAEAVAEVRAAARGRRRCFLSTPNLNFAIGCRDDEAFRQSILNSDLCIADGMPLIWTARMLGVPIPERVAGSDVFAALRSDSGEPLKVYFFGGPDGAAEAACRQLNAESGGLRCVGFATPGFGSVEAMSSDALIDHINASGADFLVVALGARKGQAWIERNRDRLAVPVISHLGAVVNFVAGTVGRAPRWMRSAGLEWCWRIIEEPALWRRYLNDGLAFAGLMFGEILPALGRRRLAWRSRKRPAPATLQQSAAGGRTYLNLAGAWDVGSLGPLRRAFAELAAADDNVVLDLAGIAYLDSAFVGLLMLFAGERRQRGCCLTIVAAPPTVRRAFRALGAGYLLAAAGNTAVTTGADNTSGVSANAAVANENSMRQGRDTMISRRSAFVLAALMGLASLAPVLAKPATRAADIGAAVDLERMVPKAFGEWREEPQPLAQVVNPQTRELLDKLYSQILTRTYVNAAGQKIMLSLAYGSDQRGEMQAHKPEVCYPAQGFKLHSNEPGTLPTAYGALPVRRLATSMGSRQEPVTYWFTVGDQAVAGTFYKRLVEIRYGLTGQIPDGLLFRVSSIDPDSRRAYRTQEHFVVQLLEAVAPGDRARLSGLGKPRDAAE